MDALELLKQIERGEDSKHQFKVIVKDAKTLADEIVAFSNSLGGTIFIGVDDHCKMVGLSDEAIARVNQHISNATTNNIRPAVNVITENIEEDGKKIIALHVKEGINKPYCNNDGAFWVKNGSDKRKVTAPEELQRLFQSSGKIYADEAIIEGTGKNDIDFNKFNDYFQKVYKRNYDE
ncbi:MAG: ATP-binding protein, partial [bacterium]|nr:ATP-binding protein [bacterium]